MEDHINHLNGSNNETTTLYLASYYMGDIYVSILLFYTTIYIYRQPIQATYIFHIVQHYMSSCLLCSLVFSTGFALSEPTAEQAVQQGLVSLVRVGGG